MSSVGFTGLVTAVSVSALDDVLPDAPAKSVCVFVVGTLASWAWFEAASRYLVFRLRREQQGFERLISEYDRFDGALAGRIEARIRDLRDRGASRKVVSELEAELNQFRRQYTDLFGRFRERSAALLRQLPD